MTLRDVLMAKIRFQRATEIDVATTTIADEIIAIVVITITIVASVTVARLTNADVDAPTAAMLIPITTTLPTVIAANEINLASEADRNRVMIAQTPNVLPKRTVCVEATKIMTVNLQRRREVAVVLDKKLFEKSRRLRIDAV